MKQFFYGDSTTKARHRSALGRIRPRGPVGRVRAEGGKSGVGSPSRGDCVRVRRAVSLLILGVSLFTSGCKASPAWSAESRSPDGKMIATTDVFANGGFIAPGPDATFVYLNWTSGSQPKKLILAFSDGQSESDGMKVGMTWLTPAHLELTYKGQRTIDFQAVKCDGIDISVRELSSDPIDGDSSK